MRRGRFGALARLVIGATLLVGVLFVAVFPTRTFLDQRRAIATVDERLGVLQSENARMRTRIRALSTPGEVERIAREEYNLAKPGEEVYVIIPSEIEAVRRAVERTGAVRALSRAWGVGGDAEE